MEKVLLKDIAYAMSGDKGDVCDMGVMAKKHEYYDIIVNALTAEAIKKHFGEIVRGDVKVYTMPNIESVKCVLYQALDGGATRTLRFDFTGKAMCTALLRMEVEIPDELQVVEE